MLKPDPLRVVELLRVLAECLDRGDSLVTQLPGLGRADARHPRQLVDRMRRVVGTNILQLL